MTPTHVWRIIRAATTLRASEVPEETVPLLASSGRVSATDVRAPSSWPPFDVSALDGYALKGPGTTFRIKGFLEPLAPEAPVMKKGEALFVATGGRIPSMARFVRRESVKESDDGLSVLSPLDERRLWKRGYWINKGTRIVSRGEVIGPSAIESLALARITKVHVIRRPSVAILTTGDELKKGRVPDSNKYLLASLAERDGAAILHLATAGDSETEIAQSVAACEGADLLLITGGTSRGKRDLTYGALEGLEADFLLRQPPFLPGRTMAFGRARGSLFFVLPGNPRALRTLYELFVGHALRMLCGRRDMRWKTGTFILEEGVEKGRGTTLFVPVRISWKEDTVARVYGGRPDGFAVIGRDLTRVFSGEKVRVVWREKEYQ